MVRMACLMKEGALDVDAHSALEVSQLAVGQQRGGFDTGVIDQYIEAAKALHGSCYRGLPVRLDSDILMHIGHASRVHSIQRRTGLFTEAVQQVADHHAGAHLQQRISNFRTQATGTTRDQRHLAIQSGRF